MLNNCTIMGRLTKDPEIHYTQAAEPASVARFSLAVDRDYKKGNEKITDFFEIEAWRQRAEFAQKHLKKGQQIIAQGSFEQQRWTDKDGNKRTGYRLNVSNFYFADSKKADSENQGDSYDGGYPEESYNPQSDYPQNYSYPQNGYQQNSGYQQGNEIPTGFDLYAGTQVPQGYDPYGGTQAPQGYDPFAQ